MASTSKGAQPPSDGDDRDELSIGELAERTGVRPATLRAWETRFGFPRPVRLDSGHRRYPESVVDEVDTVLRRQRRGLRLEAAIAGRGTSSTDAEDPSVFRALIQGRSATGGRRLRKRTLVALSHAIEDEICTSAAAPMMFGAFQTVGRYAQSQARWQELARTAASTVVFADFDDVGGERSTEPMRVSLPRAAGMRREWAVVGDDPDLSVCLAGWELPGQSGVPDGARIFETTWTLEPALVRRAARSCVDMVVAAGAPGGTALTAELDAAPTPSAIDPEPASRLFERFVTYLDRAGRGAP